MVMKPLTHLKFIGMLLVLACFCFSMSVPLLTQAQTNSMFPVLRTNIVASFDTAGIPGTVTANVTTEERLCMIVNKKSGKALDAGGAGGNVVYPYPTPDRNNNWHLWRLEQVGDYYMVINKQSGKALDAGGENGNVVYPYPTPDRNNNWHLWRLEKVGDYYLVINKQSGKALDAGGENGNVVYPYPTPDRNNEWHLWSIQSLPNPTFNLTGDLPRLGDRREETVRVNVKLEETKEKREKVIPFVPPAGWVIESANFHEEFRTGNSGCTVTRVDNGNVAFLNQNSETYRQTLDYLSRLEGTANLEVAKVNALKELKYKYENEFSSFNRSSANFSIYKDSLAIEYWAQCRWRQWPMYTEYLTGGKIVGNVVIKLVYVGSPDHVNTKSNEYKQMADQVLSN